MGRRVSEERRSGSPRPPKYGKEREGEKGVCVGECREGGGRGRGRERAQHVIQQHFTAHGPGTDPPTGVTFTIFRTRNPTRSSEHTTRPGRHSQSSEHATRQTPVDTRVTATTVPSGHPTGEPLVTLYGTHTYATYHNCNDALKERRRHCGRDIRSCLRLPISLRIAIASVTTTTTPPSLWL